MNILISRFHHPLALKLKGAVGKQTIATVTVCSSLGVTGGADANFFTLSDIYPADISVRVGVSELPPGE